MSRDLTVFEGDLHYPVADINWRGDPPGDRHAQVDAIVTRAANWGLNAFNRGREVRVFIDMRRFHALSRKARRDTGGVHSMRFDLTVADAKTNELLLGPYKVVADLRAFGGAEARTAVEADLTQKSRIIQHLAGVLQDELIAADMGKLVYDGTGG